MVQSWIFPYFLAVSILPDLSTIQGLLLHLYVGQNCSPSVVIVSICGGSSVGSSRIHSSFLNQLRASSSYSSIFFWYCRICSADMSSPGCTHSPINCCNSLPGVLLYIAIGLCRSLRGEIPCSQFCVSP
ncbi:hypothetical protein PF002_g32554 [Phytophthora fragariae]|uniref:Uncharacterized protein n=1 Tax=Phytophthora fragariae TaxID=53985 RepID=A0A6A3PQT3_9STRA|nr:hypothetical protein PF003_g29685 [Phytophthora fragariae]KAE8917088.1 hypothetical protein PF009_g32591 [Phytophthora fragariae]KAE8965947.1 hypothetical protein PF011_g28109 [Phytophthora fragariae]KAE9056338.1 hypothetical protein PF007_g32030 [Phytophthora fragariae]KAE9160721.1 hypothetical protein PF002_g32554 [Phytophthora fragariae]